MDEEVLLKEFVKKEEESGCYTCCVAGDYVYNIIRADIRRLYIKMNGLEIMPFTSPLQKRKAILSFFISFWHLLKLSIKRGHIDNIIFPFHRVEKVDNLYIDKFTDPVIEFSSLKNNCLIFERSRAGVHCTPRIHAKMVVFTDVFDVFARLYAILFSRRFGKKYKNQFNRLFEIVNHLVPYSENDRKCAIRKIMEYRALAYFYRNVYRKLSPKRVLVVPRVAFLPQMVEAKKRGITTIEFQHGITYGETSVYSGRRESLFTPDYFFAFGNMPPRNVYGIDENRIINIGWAFPLLLKKLSTILPFSDKDILIISDPEITDKIVNIVEILAEVNPAYTFHIRPHPMEILQRKHRIVIDCRKNILLQDNKINSNVVLNSFIHIIGENSTVLYEALAMGKKVGKLCYPAFRPKYLNPTDKEAVWEIASQEDFEKYVSESIATRRSLSIYSEFDGKKIDELF